MKPAVRLTLPAQLAIAALLVLGLLGGSLVLAHAGFETSPRRGGAPTFVPFPQAWVLVVVMYLMSLLAMLTLLRQHRAAKGTMAAATGAYAGVAWWLVDVLGQS